MENPMKLLSGILALAALLVVGASSAHADEWPMWRGPAQNGTSTDKGLPSAWSPDGAGQTSRARAAVYPPTPPAARDC